MNTTTLEIIDEQLATSAITWRRDLHKIPELQVDLFKTKEYITKLLDAWDVEYSESYAKTGLVATIHGRNFGKTIAFRCDMDALPMEDESGKPWKSTHPGCSHSCGHDGHMAITLATISYLNTNRDFSGTVKFLFQPNEETGQGAKQMMAEGLYKDHPYSELYGFHNMPRLKENTIQARYGATTGAGEFFSLSVTGKSGHSSVPEKCINPITVSSEIINGWMSITDTITDAMAVISICKISSGTAMNAIPETTFAGGTMRYFEAHIADYMKDEMHRIASEISQKYSATYDILFETLCPATINTKCATDTVIEVAQCIYGEERVIDNVPASPGGEDMQYFVTDQVKEACWFMIGTNGQNTHTVQFDFDDTCIRKAASMLVNIAKNRLSK